MNSAGIMFVNLCLCTAREWMSLNIARLGICAFMCLRVYAFLGARVHGHA